MSGDFDTSEELKAEIELKKLEELIAILPQDIPLRKDFECQLIIWKVKAKRWRKKSEKRVIKINGSTETNKSTLSRYVQVIRL